MTRIALSLACAGLVACSGGSASSGALDAGSGSAPLPPVPPSSGDVDAGVPASPADGGVSDAAPATCASKSGAAYPFGSHCFPYVAGSILPRRTRAQLDDATAAFYDAWKAKYLVAGCGGYYVFTEKDGAGGGGQSKTAITVSEAHGYGMIVTALMAGHDPDARKIFDGFHAFFRKFPSTRSPDLMAWEQVKGCIDADGPDSATDGDLDIAFALLLADAQWGSGGAVDYRAEAKKVIAAALAHEVQAKTHLTYLGDWAQGDAKYEYGTRPSDFMLDHFRAFGRASGDAAWASAVDASYAVLDTMHAKFATKTFLVPDFVIATDTAPAPAPSKYLEDVTDGQYGYNACRVPWRVATDYLVSGEPRAKALADGVSAWIRGATGGDASKIEDGYTLAGATASSASGESFAFTGPFGVAAMADPANQAWLDAIWKRMVEDTPAPNADEAYYGNTVKLLTMLVMSNNWVVPQ